MNEKYIEPDQEYVYRVVDRKGNPLKTRMSGTNGIQVQYTVRTYQTGTAAAGVATRKNNELDHDEYRVQVSKVEWHDFDPVNLEIAS